MCACTFIRHLFFHVSLHNSKLQAQCCTGHPSDNASTFPCNSTTNCITCACCTSSLAMQSHDFMSASGSPLCHGDNFCLESPDMIFETFAIAAICSREDGGRSNKASHTPAAGNDWKSMSPQDPCQVQNALDPQLDRVATGCFMGCAQRC